ncbi:AraC family transcriptional regulator [Microbacteriaceae bacterium K1510]|nr:AraC family transcriptional regulator [Microbacteriaceae bacterium K1510]
MGKARRYGDAVAHSHGLREAPMLASTSLGDAPMAVTKIVVGHDDLGMKEQIPAQDAFSAALYLTDVPYNELWRRGRPYLNQGYAANALRVVHLEDELSTYVAHPHQALSFYIPRASFDSLTEEDGKAPVSIAGTPGIIDPTIAHLGRALLPALERPNEVPALFVDSVFLAVLARLMSNHSGRSAPPAKQAGLSLQQQRRAIDYLTAHFAENIRLADVATACGLSRDYFIRSFRRATGFTPHRWLMHYRVAQAKETLRSSNLSLAEIALRCGFADQSHFTRVFSSSEGISPAAWRKRHSL